jgi:hypothetical protein
MANDDIALRAAMLGDASSLSKTKSGSTQFKYGQFMALTNDEAMGEQGAILLNHLTSLASSIKVFETLGYSFGELDGVRDQLLVLGIFTLKQFSCSPHLFNGEQPFWTETTSVASR